MSSFHRPFAARSLPVIVGLGAFLVAHPCRGDGAQELVKLSDGSEVQGTLVEKVPGDHVTIVLATGSTRTIPWSDVVSAETSSGMTTMGDALPAPTIDPSSDVVADWPEPDRTPLTFRGGRFLYGVGTGAGTPTGYLGALVGWDPTPWLEFEGGVGLGGKFGWGLGGGVRLNAPLLDSMRYGIGVGLSENFLSAGARAPGGDDAGAPATAHFLNVDMNQDYALGTSAFLRFTFGFAFLLNASDYAAMCSGANAGTNECEFSVSMPMTPKTAAERAVNGGHAFLPYFGLELLWLG